MPFDTAADTLRDRLLNRHRVQISVEQARAILADVVATLEAPAAGPVPTASPGPASVYRTRTRTFVPGNLFTEISAIMREESAAQRDAWLREIFELVQIEAYNRNPSDFTLDGTPVREYINDLIQRHGAGMRRYAVVADFAEPTRFMVMHEEDVAHTRRTREIFVLRSSTLDSIMDP